jgi:outer membrane murein-binding lipoprotein Lpp
MKSKNKNITGSKYETVGFKAFAAIIILSVVATVVAGLWLAGSPAQERARRLDASRVSSLQSIANAIDQYYNNQNALPPDLETLAKARETYYIGGLNDPETGVPYDYAIRGTDTYDLCATFSTDTMDQESMPTEPYQRWEGRFWEHRVGRTCFNITAQTYPK